MASSTVRRVLYVGNKERKADNVTDSGLAWGRGEIKDVPASYAARLTRHADVWVDVTDLSGQEIALLGAKIKPRTDAAPGEDPEKAVLKDRIGVLERQVDVLDAKLQAETAIAASLRQENGELKRDRAALRERVEKLNDALGKVESLAEPAPENGAAPGVSANAAGGLGLAGPVLPALDALPDLGKMTAPQLAEYAGRELGLALDPKDYPDHLRQAIVAKVQALG